MRVRTTCPRSLAVRIKAEIARLLGLPVCVGVASTKVLAKLANRTAKKVPQLGGVCVWAQVPAATRAGLVDRLPVSEVWGIATRLERRLAAAGYWSVGDLMRADPVEIRGRFTVVVMRLVLELQGTPAMVWEEQRQVKDQLIYSRSFAEPIATAAQMRQVLSIYAAAAAARLVRHRMRAGYLSAFCATSRFSAGVDSYPSVGVPLAEPTDDPATLAKAAGRLLEAADFTHARYAKAGVILTDLRTGPHQHALPRLTNSRDGADLAGLIEQINARVGPHALGIGYGGLANPPQWTMRRQMLSRRAATHWNELAIATI